MHTKTLLAALAAAALCVEHAGAATLWTAPLNASFGDHDLYCIARNVSTSARSITIRAYDFGGNEVEVYAEEVDPGALTGTGVTAETAASCRFEVEGSARSVRASAVYYQDNTLRVSVPAE